MMTRLLSLATVLLAFLPAVANDYNGVVRTVPDISNERPVDVAGKRTAAADF